MAQGYPSPQIELHFGDGEYLFKFGLAQIAELERLCGVEGKPVGVGAIFARLLKGRYKLRTGEHYGDHLEADYRVSDIYETIRLALTAGGKGVVNGEEVSVTATRARTLCDTYVLGVPLKHGWETAVAILTALIEGYEAPGEGASTAKKAEAEPTSSPGPSTSPEPSPTAPP